ncbi:MAG: hypothetical protein C3F11_07210 [Methylocystaceae bacterium]|nr:MAG: hypothetical protein C3F11_07210 [Methylocystaceae bacterium]
MIDFTVHLRNDTAAKLDKLAEKLELTPNHVATQAIEDFVTQEEWRLAEIEAGLAEAERGDFATNAEMATVIGKYIDPTRRA